MKTENGKAQGVFEKGYLVHKINEGEKQAENVGQGQVWKALKATRWHLDFFVQHVNSSGGVASLH